ncbi:MAG TPA: hypothetical protein PKE64_16250 [Anaerolineae bacterium]|nr:hypothetical protein [Anaerolineae bacterium]
MSRVGPFERPGCLTIASGIDLQADKQGHAHGHAQDSRQRSVRPV